MCGIIRPCEEPREMCQIKRKRLGVPDVVDKPGLETEFLREVNGVEGGGPIKPSAVDCELITSQSRLSDSVKADFLTSFTEYWEATGWLLLGFLVGGGLIFPTSPVRADAMIVLMGCSGNM